MKVSRSAQKRAIHSVSGISKADVVVTITVIALLLALGWLWRRHAKSAAQTAVCANNLKLLGQGFMLYQEHNDSKLPYAFIHYADLNKISWDTMTSPYARAAARGPDANLPPPSLKVLKQALLCPMDDTQPRDWGKSAGRRTYSMPWHNMENDNWPPGPDNSTGVGLWWASYGRANAKLSTLKQLKEGLPAVRKDMILSPADTMLLTEQSRSNNIVANSASASIRTTGEQVEARPDREPIPYHVGKLNYLMIDGHVEAMTYQKTVGRGGVPGTNYSTHHGIWTIKVGD